MSRHRIFSTESILSLMVINTFKKNRQVYWFVLLIKHIGKCRSSIKSALKELDEAGLLVRRSGGFSKPNHLYIKIPVEEIYQKNRNSTPLENGRSYKLSWCKLCSSEYAGLSGTFTGACSSSGIYSDYTCTHSSLIWNDR